MRWNIPRIWEGGDVFIIGGGPSVPFQFGVPEDVYQDVAVGKRLPSAYSKFMKSLHGKHVVGVNNAYLIGLWIDVAFFGDHSWYLVHRMRLAKFPNLKVTCNPRFDGKTSRNDRVKFVARDREKRFGISPDPSKVAWNNNSGAAAINLAVHLGAKRIVLLGFDMKGNGAYTHWHGSHHRNEKDATRIKSPPFRRHLKGFPTIARDAKKMGVEILNASPDSAIDVFPKASLLEVLEI